MSNSSKNSLTVCTIAQILKGELLLHGAVSGNPSESESAKAGETAIQSIKPLAEAGPDDLTFFSPTGRKTKAAELLALARDSKAAAIIVAEFDEAITAAQIKVKNPLAAIVQISTMFFLPPAPLAGAHPTAIVDSSARVPTSAHIGAYAVIGRNVVLGENVTLHPHVVLYDGVEIGDGTVLHAHAVVREGVILGKDCLIQSGVVIGGDGFGYYPDKALGHARIPHIGSVRLGDRVDLGSNTTVDRAMIGNTKLGTATKVDNLVMIGHNTVIGERGLLCGMVGVSGSCTIGNDVILAGNAGVADHVTIGDNVRAAAKAGISFDVPPGIDIAGHPQVEAPLWRRQVTALSKLPEALRRVSKLEQELLKLRVELENSKVENAKVEAGNK